MTMKFWRLKFKGERSADEIQSAIGQIGGNVLRIHVEAGETEAYFAAERAGPDAAKVMKGATVEEVNAGEVTKLGGKTRTSKGKRS